MTASAHHLDGRPLATPRAGPVVGTWHGPTAVFAGIPYACAGRFGPPRPVEPWSVPLDAATHGAQSPQRPGALERLLGDPGIPSAEACHHLTVYTPSCDGADRPVLVWIHGGAFVTGSGSMPWYDGTALCELGDVVVVTINYRLGALGFAGTTNCGLADQVAALEWVASSIGAFGGDPGNVTVFGESAGGASVVALLAAPSARHLFARAWAMSPSLTQLRTAARAHDVTVQLRAAAGLGPPSSPDDLAGLADLDVETLLAAQSAVLADPAAAITAFSPTVDGRLVPGPFVDAAAADPRPLVLGTTRDEMHLFNAFDPANAAVDHDALRAAARRRLGPAADTALARYRELRPGSTPGQLLSAVQTDEAFRVPARELGSRRSSTGSPTWMYWFTYATPAFGGLLGACHGLDIPFTFHNLDRRGVEMFTGSSPDRIAVADELAGALLRFARHGAPGWPAYDTSTRTTRVVDVASHDLDDPEAELRLAWEAAREMSGVAGGAS